MGFNLPFGAGGSVGKSFSLWGGISGLSDEIAWLPWLAFPFSVLPGLFQAWLFFFFFLRETLLLRFSPSVRRWSSLPGGFGASVDDMLKQVAK